VIAISEGQNQITFGIGFGK